MFESPLVPVLSMSLITGIAVGLRNLLEPSRKAELKDQATDSEQPPRAA